MDDYVGSLLQLFFHYTACLVVRIHGLLLTSILGRHNRSSTRVAYTYLKSGIRAALHSSWSGFCAIVICDGYKGLEWTATYDQKYEFMLPFCYVCNMSLLTGITIGSNCAHSQ
jgi:hypothetical protein